LGGSIFFDGLTLTVAAAVEDETDDDEIDEDSRGMVVRSRWVESIDDEWVC
jgi:hypothetical protein